MPYRNAHDSRAVSASQGAGVITDMLGADIIALVQETVGKITGLALSVLDAEGREIVASSNTSPLCRRRRRDTAASSLCAASDTFGADQAFARQERFIYFCPCGLVRAVIPVIAHGRYLGGLFIGQVWCDNAPESTPRLERLLEEEMGKPGGWQFRELRDATPTYDFSYFAYITDTLAKVVETVSAREAGQRARLGALEAERAGLEERVRQLEREVHIRESALHHWKARLNLEFMVNGLNSVASLAVLDNAPRVNEMCVLFADHLRRSLAVAKDFTPLRDEVEMLSGYLAMQRMRYGEALCYSVDVPEEVGKCRIPSLVLLPLVESAVLNGLTVREDGYRLALSAALEENEVTIRLEDNVPLSAERGAGQGALPAQSGFDADGVAANLATARTRLRTMLGSRQELRFVAAPGGSACILRYTLPHLEGPA